MEHRLVTTPVPDSDRYHLYSSGNKRRKLSHLPFGQSNTSNQEETSSLYRQPLLIPSQPSSCQSSPLQPTTPDQSQSSDRSCSTESDTWSSQSRLDEIELLSVIERHAETYTSEFNYDQGVFPASPPLIWDHKLNYDVSYHTPSPADRLKIAPPTIPSFSLPTHQSHNSSNSPNLQDSKPYKCTVCPKAFTRNYDLTRHKSSHQDQRQHVCSKCGRSFNRRDALVRHASIRGCGTTPYTQ